jgi:DNA-binding response OmpR family regulator
MLFPFYITFSPIVIGCTLEKEQFEVFWFKTVEEIENFSSVSCVDIILLDHGIRGYEKSGIDIIQNLRHKFHKSKIIMLSNYSQRDLQEKAFSLGADEYLIKMNTPPKVLLEILKRKFL